MTNRERFDRLVKAQTEQFGSDPNGNYYTNPEFVKECYKVMDELDRKCKYDTSMLAYYNDCDNNQLYIQLKGYDIDNTLGKNEYLNIQVNEDGCYINIFGSKGVNDKIYCDEIHGINRYVVDAINTTLDKMAAKLEENKRKFVVFIDKIRDILDGTGYTVRYLNVSMIIFAEDGRNMLTARMRKDSGDFELGHISLYDAFGDGSPVVEKCKRLGYDYERTCEILDVFTNINKFAR